MLLCIRFFDTIASFLIVIITIKIIMAIANVERRSPVSIVAGSSGTSTLARHPHPAPAVADEHFLVFRSCPVLAGKRFFWSLQGTFLGYLLSVEVVDDEWSVRC